MRNKLINYLVNVQGYSKEYLENQSCAALRGRIKDMTHFYNTSIPIKEIPTIVQI